MTTLEKSTRKNVRLPLVAGDDFPRPQFGSAQVAAYGAVGLDITLYAPEESADAHGSAARTDDGKRETLRVNTLEKLSIVEGIAYHRVDDDHLWIGVEDGVVLVLNNAEHRVMKALVAGLTPDQAAQRVKPVIGIDAQAASKAVSQMIGRLAAAGFLRGFRGYHRVKSIRTNRHARFHLTNRCQLECVHCYTDSGPHLPADDELSTERWLTLVDEFADNGGETLLFAGGEALVHRGCIAIMKHAKRRGLVVTLFSNGILIPRFVHELKGCVDTVQISVDGADAGSHDKIRGSGSFRKAMRALEVLLEANISTRVNTTLMAENWTVIQEHFPALVARFEGTGLKFRMSYGAMPHGRGEGLDHAQVDPNALRRYVDDVFARLRKSEDRAQLPNTVTKVSGCGYAEQLVVASNGFVYPCHLLSGALGHVDDLPVAKIQEYLARTAEAFSVKHRQGCSTCDLRHLCGGTCRVEDEKHTGSRLITTCGPEQKLRKKRFLVSRYRPIQNRAL